MRDVVTREAQDVREVEGRLEARGRRPARASGLPPTRPLAARRGSAGCLIKTLLGPMRLRESLSFEISAHWLGHIVEK